MGSEMCIRDSGEPKDGIENSDLFGCPRLSAASAGDWHGKRPDEKPNGDNGHTDADEIPVAEQDPPDDGRSGNEGVVGDRANEPLSAAAFANHCFHIGHGADEISSVDSRNCLGFRGWPGDNGHHEAGG